MKKRLYVEPQTCVYVAESILLAVNSHSESDGAGTHQNGGDNGGEGDLPPDGSDDAKYFSFDESFNFEGRLDFDL